MFPHGSLALVLHRMRVFVFILPLINIHNIKFAQSIFFVCSTQRWHGRDGWSGWWCACYRYRTRIPKMNHIGALLAVCVHLFGEWRRTNQTYAFNLKRSAFSADFPGPFTVCTVKRKIRISIRFSKTTDRWNHNSDSEVYIRPIKEMFEQIYLPFAKSLWYAISWIQWNCAAN